MARSIVRKADLRFSEPPSEGGGVSSMLMRLAYWIYLGGSTPPEEIHVPPLEYQYIPYNVAESSVFEWGAGFIGGKTVTFKADIAIGGFYRLHAITQFRQNEVNIPHPHRMRLVGFVKSGSGDLIRSAVLDEIYFPSEPQGDVGPFNSVWRGVAPALHGETVLEASAGDSLGAEIWWAFSGSTPLDVEEAVISYGSEHERTFIERIGTVELDQPPEAPVGGGITFGADSPGALTLEDGIYYADYAIAPTHFGYSQAQAEALIEQYLLSSQGWEEAGIVFRQSSSPKVLFQVVEEATCGAPELACTHFNHEGSGVNYVELEYRHLESQVYPSIGAGNIINHEAGHAFFYAEHTGSGIMADFDNERPDWPTTADLQSVVDWLAS
jgi:hypothetical protein